MSEIEFDPSAARKKAIQMLSRREYSAAEILQKLQNGGFATKLIEQLIAQLQAEGLQSDERFAESYTRYRQAKGFGPVRIGLELKQKGVAQSLIAQVLNACEVPWDEKITQVRIRRFGEAMPEDMKSRAKQINFLQYRGFTSEQIHWLMSMADVE